MSKPNPNERITEILEMCVNTIGVAPHLLYHSDEEKKVLKENAIPNATQSLLELFAEVIPEKKDEKYGLISRNAGYNQAIDEMRAKVGL
jgi:hypothetical protein